MNIIATSAPLTSPVLTDARIVCKNTLRTKTNINLIVNGEKVYTRKTSGRPYTHALVFKSQSGWRIVSCSSTGPATLARQIINLDNYLVLPIIDNTVTLAV